MYPLTVQCPINFYGGKNQLEFIFNSQSEISDKGKAWNELQSPQRQPTFKSLLL